MQKKLHLISFDIPYPPSYGGVIDVFFKLKALHASGVQITLHCFQYGQEQQKILEQYCKRVYYYERNSSFKSLISNEVPFIAKSRGNDQLVANLKKEKAPILFDGLHTTYVLSLANFSDRKLYLRAHNVEHRFYKGLAKSESNIFKRNFFKQEAKKLKKYEKVLKDMEAVFTISPYEQEYFVKKYGEKCTYIPAFHDHEVHTQHKTGKDTVLYHGNISVSENVKAALFLIEVYKNSPYQLKIASSYTNNDILKEIAKYPNIHFQHLKDQDALYQLFEEAHINVLPTFQKTGIKLKLLNTLYQGKFVIANDYMVEDTGLESLCERANSKSEFLQATKTLLAQSFSKDILEKRKEILQNFSPETGAQQMVEIIFN